MAPNTLAVIADHGCSEPTVYDRACERAAYYGKWRAILWATHLWLTGLSYTFAVLVPFGLALLLYAPEQWRFAINVSTLVGSCLSLLLHGLDMNQRLPDRSALLKKCEARMELALSRHRSGFIDERELSEILETVQGLHADYDGN